MFAKGWKVQHMLGEYKALGMKRFLISVIKSGLALAFSTSLSFLERQQINEIHSENPFLGYYANETWSNIGISGGDEKNFRIMNSL